MSDGEYTLVIDTDRGVMFGFEQMLERREGDKG